VGFLLKCCAKIKVTGLLKESLMSDRMLNVCSTLVLILVVFAIFLVLTDLMKPFLHFAQGVWDVIVMVGGSGTSMLGLRIRSARMARSSDEMW